MGIKQNMTEGEAQQLWSTLRGLHYRTSFNSHITMGK
jgi:hypothetical protein